MQSAAGMLRSHACSAAARRNRHTPLCWLVRSGLDSCCPAPTVGACVVCDALPCLLLLLPCCYHPQAPKLGGSKVIDREDDYKRRRLNQRLSPDRADAFQLGEQTPAGHLQVRMCAGVFVEACWLQERPAQCRRGQVSGVQVSGGQSVEAKSVCQHVTLGATSNAGDTWKV